MSKWVEKGREKKKERRKHVASVAGTARAGAGAVVDGEHGVEMVAPDGGGGGGGG